MDLVVGASSFALKNLESLVDQYTLIRGVPDDIQYINDELASMQAFLHRLKRAGDLDEQRQVWMNQVRRVASDIEDYVDYVRLRLGGEPRGRGRLMYLRRKWYLLTTLYARRCIATDIGVLKVRAQHVSERRTRYGVEIPAKANDDDGSDSSPAPPPQLIGTVEPVGIKGAKKNFERWFKPQRIEDRHLRFLAIVGIGGIGKTTLALALYHAFGDEFDCRANALASQKFHLPTVLRSLIKQFHHQQAGAPKNDIEGIEEWRLEHLKKQLADQLEGQRYHILIDDIWSVSAFESIRDSFPKSMKGSRIVVTTRFKSVAEACRRQQGCLYQLEPLNDDYSYQLFRQIISSAPNVPTNGARALLKKCRGLPLVIILVAGLVTCKLRSYVEAQEAVRNDISKWLDIFCAQVGNELGDKLEKKLSTEEVTHIVVNHCYYQLPADLKTCLLYLCMFPKGCLISKKRLIRRWIIEGFITNKHRRTIEEASEDCFNELISRNLIRAVGNSSNGQVKGCHIHDMVLEYIIYKSSAEKFVTVVGGQWHTPLPGDDNFNISSTVNVRWLSIHKSDRQEKEVVDRMKLLHVRSLMVLGSFRVLHSSLPKFQLLQMLDLEGCKDFTSNHFKKICYMFQLKYLSLRGTDIESVPMGIGRLKYLLVLDIRDTKISQLPLSVEHLQYMVHLLAGSKSKRMGLKLNEGITRMMALQTLSGVEIRGSSVNALRALENLTNLKKLTVYRLRAFTGGDNSLLLSAAAPSSFLLSMMISPDLFTTRSVSRHWSMCTPLGSPACCPKCPTGSAGWTTFRS